LKRRALAALVVIAACGSRGDGGPLITGLADPVELAVDDSGIYVSEGAGRLVQFRLDGGGRTALATAPEIHQLALDADHVYYAAIDRAHQRIVVRSLDKVSRVSSFVVAGWPVIDIAVDATHVYWAGDQLRRIAKQGGRVAMVVDAMARGQILVDGDWIYFGGPTALARVPKAGGPVEVLFTTEGEPIEIVVHGRDVWWIEERGMSHTLEHGTIGAAPRSIALAGPPFAVAGSGDQVYVTDATGAVERVDARGTVTTIGRTPSPVDVAVHGDFVYVIDDKAPGAVYRFAR
jgi:hypothetical protein